MLLDDIRELFQDCEDVKFYRHVYDDGCEFELVYCLSLVKEQLVNEMVLPELRRLHAATGFDDVEAIRSASTVQIEQLNGLDDVASAVFAGQAIIFFPRLRSSISLSIADIPHRDTEASNIDVSIRGPKDGLVEMLEVNVGLVRKRLPTPRLGLEITKIGKVSRTRVGLLYLKGKIQEETLNEIRSRLQNVRMKLDGIFVFSPRQFRGELKEEQIAGKRYMDEHSVRMPVSVRIDGKAAVLVVLNRPRVRIRHHSVADEKVAFDVSIRMSGYIDEMLKEISSEEITAKIREIVQQDVRSAFENGRRINADVLNLTVPLYRYHYPTWKRIVTPQLDMRKVELHRVDVAVNISNAGKYKARLK